MKIYKLSIRMPSYWGEEDAKAKEAADTAAVEAFMASLRSAAKEPGRAASYILTADDFAAAVVHFSTADYNSPKLGASELVMDTIDPMAALLPLLDRMELAAARLTAEANYCQPAPAFSSHTNSPLSGPNLLGISRLKLVEDCCTDALQSELDDGWRLVAVCPQEARRPDYILGRAGEPGKAYGRAER